MNFEPQKFYIGLIDFFSILLPGALLSYLLKDDLGPRFFGKHYGSFAEAEGWMVFLFSSYLIGHFIFLLGSWLLDDHLYDPLRNATYQGQIKRLAKGETLSAGITRHLAKRLVKRDADKAVNLAEKIKEHYLDPLKASSAINTFQWSKARLTLDQHAFETNKRKLQLSKTISLARMAPFEFQRFRETGAITFGTPMELFDRDFPGHYLRLIHKVRTSVIALIPPTEGIRASLSTTGLSRVVIGPEVFQTVVVRRGPESVALSTPSNATGLFELEAQSEMLLPFEGMGVDTTWEFHMPKGANFFDYRTIADVLITIEYTALQSFDYQQQVIQTLSPAFSADRPFSFRLQFADQWYDLHNPDQTSVPMTVRFKTVREDFAPNLDSLKIDQVVLCFARTNGRPSELPVTSLRFIEEGGAGFTGGESTPIEGVISTRRGNAGSWMAMIGKVPMGIWELAQPNTQEIRALFKNKEIEDILFVITYSGRTPEWPS